MSPELRMPGGVGGRRGQSRLLPDARVQANLHQYLSTHVIPAQAGIQEGERKNFWIPACAGMTFWNREKSRNSGDIILISDASLQKKKPMVKSSRGHFYFGQRGHYHFGTTPGFGQSLNHAEGKHGIKGLNLY